MFPSGKFYCSVSVIIKGYAFSEDGEYLAYGTSASGSDWVEIRFLRVEDAVPLEDRLERVKFSCMSWTHDGKGLFYNSYPDQEGKSDGKASTLSVQPSLIQEANKKASGVTCPYFSRHFVVYHYWGMVTEL